MRKPFRRRRRPATRRIKVDLRLEDNFTESMRRAAAAAGRFAAASAYDGQKVDWPAEIYRMQVFNQRISAQTFLVNLLDDFCREYGWDPKTVWREPRRRELYGPTFGGTR